MKGAEAWEAGVLLHLELAKMGECDRGSLEAKPILQSYLIVDTTRIGQWDIQRLPSHHPSHPAHYSAISQQPKDLQCAI